MRQVLMIAPGFLKRDEIICGDVRDGIDVSQKKKKWKLFENLLGFLRDGYKTVTTDNIKKIITDNKKKT